VGLQSSAVEHLSRLELAGVPRWSPAFMRANLEGILAAAEVSYPGLERLLSHWDARWAAIGECGLPETLFHGDAHGGNSRIDTAPPVVFDWGDSGIGHPLLDLAVTSDTNLHRYWLDRWGKIWPDSHPHQAWLLLEPIAAVRKAIVYQRFLDGIEPDERPYHRFDVKPALDQAEDLISGAG
jgi:aminoglycoside phosphotransferase (APT) family kinase protein